MRVVVDDHGVGAAGTHAHDCRRAARDRKGRGVGSCPPGGPWTAVRDSRRYRAGANVRGADGGQRPGPHDRRGTRGSQAPVPHSAPAPGVPSPRGHSPPLQSRLRVHARHHGVRLVDRQLRPADRRHRAAPVTSAISRQSSSLLVPDDKVRRVRFFQIRDIVRGQCEGQGADGVLEVLRLRSRRSARRPAASAAARRAGCTAPPRSPPHGRAAASPVPPRGRAGSGGPASRRTASTRPISDVRGNSMSDPEAFP